MPLRSYVVVILAIPVSINIIKSINKWYCV